MGLGTEEDRVIVSARQSPYLWTFMEPKVDSKEPIQPSYAAWRAGTTK
jgi:hypothetical protein